MEDTIIIVLLKAIYCDNNTHFILKGGKIKYGGKI